MVIEDTHFFALAMGESFDITVLMAQKVTNACRTCDSGLLHRCCNGQHFIVFRSFFSCGPFIVAKICLVVWSNRWQGIGRPIILPKVRQNSLVHSIATVYSGTTVKFWRGYGKKSTTRKVVGVNESRFYDESYLSFPVTIPFNHN